MKQSVYKKQESTSACANTKTNVKEKPSSKNFLKSYRKRLSFFILVLLVSSVLLRFFTGPCLVSGNSMENTLHNMDFLLSQRTGYLFNAPKRFDIVEFYPSKDKSIQYIKRVIGLPGETVQIGEDGNIYINGQMLEDDYGREPILDAGCASGNGITLEDDEVFCLGDNRNESLDSRYIGPIKISQIYGHPYFRLLPLTKIGRI